MASNDNDIYVGVEDVARIANDIYVGVNNVARHVEKIWRGDEKDVAQKIYPKSKWTRHYHVTSGDPSTGTQVREGKDTGWNYTTNEDNYHPTTSGGCYTKPHETIKQVTAPYDGSNYSYCTTAVDTSFYAPETQRMVSSFQHTYKCDVCGHTVITTAPSRTIPVKKVGSSYTMEYTVFDYNTGNVLVTRGIPLVHNHTHSVMVIDYYERNCGYTKGQLIDYTE